MARKPKVQRLIRLPAAVNEWLKDRAVGNDQNVTAELTNILKTMMEADPLRIVVRYCRVEGDEWYAASVGEHGDDFFENRDKGLVLFVARERAEELGLSRSSVVIIQDDVLNGEAA